MDKKTKDVAWYQGLKVWQKVLVWVGGFWVTGLTLNILGEGDPVPVTMTVAAVETTTTHATTTTPSTTTTTPPTTTTEAELRNEEMRQLWLLTVRQQSAELEEITWVDASTDAQLLDILDETCGSFDDGESKEIVGARLYVAVRDTYGEDGVNDDDLTMAGYAAGAAQIACEKR